MKAVITPGACQGVVSIPPSKSMAHRAVICASLAGGISTIINIDYSDDIKVTIEGMRQLGADIKTLEDTVIIKGISSFDSLKDTTVFCKESGSTLRFFLPIFSLCGQKLRFTGENRLLKRPQNVYQELFQEKGCSFIQTKDHIEIDSALPAGEYTLNGDVSSQFISGLLFALPLQDGDSTIHIKPPFESRSYVDLTLDMLRRYGIEASFLDEHTIHIPGNQKYQPCDYRIEGDYSQFAFFAVLAAINHDLTITGVDPSSLQGDKAILSILKDSNVSFEETKDGYLVHKSNIQGCDIDLSDCPDLGPILMVLGMYGNGVMHIDNAQRLRFKESDRISAMEQELRKFKVSVHSNHKEIFVKGGSDYLCEYELSSHKDHRIVMSLAVAAACSKEMTVINGAEAISKSYPGFFDDLKQIGIEVELHDI